MIARAGIVLAVLQFAFALTWVVYVVYLPALAAQVGLDRSLVPWILLVDQAIFVVCDWLAGVFADRLGASVSRLGRWIAVVTVVSCTAFVALPLVAPAGSAPLLTALVVLWAASSSILRAPTLALAGRHATRPQRAWLAGVYALGLGAAGVVAPSLTAALATTDPRIPFVATSCVVALMTIVLAAMPHDLPAGRAAEPSGSPASLAAFAIALAFLAIGFQVHASISSSLIYLRHVARDELASVVPVFWIGFSIASFPLALIVRRVDGVLVMAGAGVIGVAALSIAQLGDTLTIVIVAQVFAGAAWSGGLVGAFAASTALDRSAGSVTGVVFSVLAGATVARMAFTASGLAAASRIAAVLPLLPPIAWGIGTLIAASFAFRRRRSPRTPR